MDEFLKSLLELLITFRFSLLEGALVKTKSFCPWQLRLDVTLITTNIRRRKRLLPAQGITTITIIITTTIITTQQIKALHQWLITSTRNLQVTETKGPSLFYHWLSFVVLCLDISLTLKFLSEFFSEVKCHSHCFPFIFGCVIDLSLNNYCTIFNENNNESYCNRIAQSLMKHCTYLMLCSHFNSGFINICIYWLDLVHTLYYISYVIF